MPAPEGPGLLAGMSRFSTTMKVLTVLGARPQFIKAAVVSPALREAGINEILVYTGQHYDWEMSAAFFEGLILPEPKCDLQIGSGSHGAQTGRMMGALDQKVEGIDRRLARVEYELAEFRV